MTGPRALLDALGSWADRTPWVDWLEVAGSLGRGAGDEWSDVDVAIGVILDDGGVTGRVEAVR